MNPGLVIGYVIGGFVILMILNVGHNLSYSGTELAFSQIQKERSTVVKEVLLHDIPKIGYNRGTPPDTLLRSIGENHIEFYTNLDNSADRSLELIRWELTNEPIPNTNNPDDRILRRIVRNIGSADTTDFTSGVLEFNLSFFTELGSNTSVPLPMNARTAKAAIDNIIQLEIELITESAEELKYSVNTDGKYVRSMWTKRFSPVNLRDF